MKTIPMPFDVGDKVWIKIKNITSNYKKCKECGSSCKTGETSKDVIEQVKITSILIHRSWLQRKKVDEIRVYCVEGSKCLNSLEELRLRAIYATKEEAEKGEYTLIKNRYGIGYKE